MGLKGVPGLRYAAAQIGGQSTRGQIGPTSYTSVAKQANSIPEDSLPQADGPNGKRTQGGNRGGGKAKKARTTGGPSHPY